MRDREGPRLVSSAHYGGSWWQFRRLPAGIVRWTSDRTSSCRDGGDIPRDLVAGDARFDPRHELRCEALHHLPDAWPKLVENVHPRVAANRRTKIVVRSLVHLTIPAGNRRNCH